MNEKDIEQLLSVSDTSCISIIVPTHRLAPERKQDPLVVNKAVTFAKTILQSGRDPVPDTLKITDEIDKLCASINYAQTKDGIGLYVSPNLSKLVFFPFPVKQKITFGDHFDCRDLLFYKHISDFLVLLLSRKSLRLYLNKGEEQNEIVDDVFPLLYREDYEYQRACRASAESYSLKSFEKDKSFMQETRFAGFARQADRALAKYASAHLPVVLCGAPKELATYMKITRHRQYFIGKIAGNYSHRQEELARVMKKFIGDHTRAQNDLLLKKLHEYSGRNMIAKGIEDVTTAVENGTGLILLVEKDLESYLTHREGDIVDRTIRNFSAQKGRVIFIDNGMLKDFGGIALILRYNVQLN